MRYILLISVLFLASCTANTNPTKPSVTKPTSTETRTIATPTYGTGKMQVEVFADFQCPACIASNESLMPIFEEYAASGKLMITYRQFPLTSIHKNAKWDAIAALCSAEGGKYMEYKTVLYGLEKAKASKSVTDSERVALAKWIGLDEAKFAACLSSRAFEKQVESDMTYGNLKGVNGTPTIFLDGIKLDMSLFKDLNGFRTFLESRMK